MTTATAPETTGMKAAADGAEEEKDEDDDEFILVAKHILLSAVNEGRLQLDRVPPRRGGFHKFTFHLPTSDPHETSQITRAMFTLVQSGIPSTTESSSSSGCLYFTGPRRAPLVLLPSKPAVQAKEKATDYSGGAPPDPHLAWGDDFGEDHNWGPSNPFGDAY
jgi:hypothetical protein